MARLEKAVQELVSVTAGELGGRATTLIEDTSKRLEAELRLKRVAEDPEEQSEQEQRLAQRRRNRRRRHRLPDPVEEPIVKDRRLAVDPSDEKIAGVCSGIARYFGIETWVVRLGTLTGLIFMPQIVFPAYWITYFVMEHPEAEKPDKKSKKSRRKRRRESTRSEWEAGDPGSPEPSEPGSQYNARRALRLTNSDLTQAELRLRRLETFVTSDQYELQKELHRIESDASAGSRSEEGSQSGESARES